jgi:GT2 family glycosyltransferase
MTSPRLSTVVVAWRSGRDAAELAERFPDDPRYELVLVDNGGLGELPARAGVRVLTPGRNLGFAGGSNAGARAARGELLLFLNPDARPAGDPFSALLAGFEAHPEAAGLVPRLDGEDGVAQRGWQLRPLPGPLALLAHALFWNPTRGPRAEPPAGAPIEQPAAAALALRRSDFDALGGFDESYWPAWFEDVDLARRLADRRRPLLYHPAARFTHRVGSSLPTLGYGGFLIAYDRNLRRYLARHHGALWAALFTALVPLGALARIALLPLVKPRRVESRRAAARALLAVARAALAGFPAPEEAAG